MIKYSLRCASGHRFESWFANGDAFDTLFSAGHLSCAVCGASDIRKDIMAPRLSTGASAAPGADTPADTPDAPPPAKQPAHRPVPADLPAALKALRAEVERNSEYVGTSFATEARAIHEGSGPPRSIFGEAKPEEARKLLEDGVPVAPLPFIPTKKVN